MDIIKNKENKILIIWLIPISFFGNIENKLKIYFYISKSSFYRNINLFNYYYVILEIVKNKNVKY